MKFGKTLKKYSRPGWVYINYKFLKQVIRLFHPSSKWAQEHFRKVGSVSLIPPSYVGFRNRGDIYVVGVTLTQNLVEEIAKVNDFFLKREAKLKELCEAYTASGQNDDATCQDLCNKVCSSKISS